MNLIIDIGNSRTKLGLFQKGSLIKRKTIETKTLSQALVELSNAYPRIKDCIISSTAGYEDAQLDFLSKDFKVLQLSNKTSVPYDNLYETPETLGLDRIGLITSAVMKYPGRNVLVIDAGTCVTYDFVTKKGDYLGGGISPGLRIRFKGMNAFTSNLPLLETEDIENFIGNSTSSSMQTGVVNGLAHEIDGFIHQYQEKFEHLTVILTGGDAEILAKRIKNSIFANSNFLLEGLNHILEFNNNK